MLWVLILVAVLMVVGIMTVSNKRGTEPIVAYGLDTAAVKAGITSGTGDWWGPWNGSWWSSGGSTAGWSFADGWEPRDKAGVSRESCGPKQPVNYPGLKTPAAGSELLESNNSGMPMNALNRFFPYSG
jgi:hypothetical protein